MLEINELGIRDLIDRQAAIDAVIKRDANCGIDSAEVLRALPSVQPEQICKTCNRYEWAYQKGRVDMSEELLKKVKAEFGGERREDE